jgi:hypothetical protein
MCLNTLILRSVINLARLVHLRVPFCKYVVDYSLWHARRLIKFEGQALGDNSIRANSRKYRFIVP